MTYASSRISRRTAVQAGSAAALAATLGANTRAIGAAQDAVEIEYWHINTESFGLSAVQRIIELFQEEYPHITVVERFQTNSYTELLERVQTSMVAQTPPDVCQVGYSYLDYVARNFPFSTIDSLVEENGDQEFMGAFEDNILELGRIGGDLVGMPYGFSNMVVYFNAEQVTEAGYDPANMPTTWEEFREMAVAVNANTGQPPIYIQVSDDNWATQTMIDSNGGSLVRCDEGSVKAGFDQPEAVEAIQFWADLAADGLALVANADQGQQAFFTQNVTFAFQSIARRGNFESEASFDLQACAVPGFGDKSPKLTTGGNCLFVFSQDDAKKQAAWEFIKFCSSPAAQTVWVEETGYLPTRNDVADDPEYLQEFIQGNAIQQVAFNQSDVAAPWTSFPGNNGLQVGMELASAVEGALSGGQSAEEALGRAAEIANQLLEGETCEL